MISASGDEPNKYTPESIEIVGETKDRPKGAYVEPTPLLRYQVYTWSTRVSTNLAPLLDAYEDLHDSKLARTVPEERNEHAGNLLLDHKYVTWGLLFLNRGCV
jgi:hypothetical protein